MSVLCLSAYLLIIANVCLSAYFHLAVILLPVYLYMFEVWFRSFISNIFTGFRLQYLIPFFLSFSLFHVSNCLYIRFPSFLGDSSFSEAQILKQNFVNLETRMSKVDEREKSESKKFENVVGRLTNVEKSVKDVSAKSISDLEQKVKNFAKNVDENSAQVGLNTWTCEL